MDAHEVGPASEGSVVNNGLERYCGPLLPAIGFVAVGLFMGFAFFPVFAHHAEWYVGGDAWKTLDGSLSIVWGNLPLSYKYVQAPGAALLLVPAAFVIWHLRLQLPFAGIEPSALLVLLPYMLASGSSVVFATDGLARRLGVGVGRRTALDGLVATFALPVVVRWGHPEDVVSMAFAMFGASAAVEGKWWKAGWLFGLAVLFQPLAILMVPAMLALAPPRAWLRTIVLTVVPSALALSYAVLATGGNVRKFIQGPNGVGNFPTPWAWITPSAGPGLVTSTYGRGAAILLAAIIGWWACRRHVTPVQAVWCGCLAMGIRFALEPILNPYYLWPAAALLLVVIVARSSWWALAPLVAASMYTYFHREPWLYWIPSVGLVALGLVMTGRSVFLRCSARTVVSGTQVQGGIGGAEPSTLVNSVRR